MSDNHPLNWTAGDIWMNHLTRRQAVAALGALVCADAALAQNHNPLLRLSTSMGVIVIELAQAKAPLTSANFLKYVNNKRYDGTIFHRVIGNFMIQGGGFTPEMQQTPTYEPVRLETHPDLRNVRGTVAMARTSDPNSATGQFFINVKDNPMLDAPNPDGYGYAVFGKVVEGMDVVDKIRAVATGARGGHRDVPLEPVVIKSAVLIK
jgi:peptidyl-prolyl cis-trans isomerase A (cyclophilin A)